MVDLGILLPAGDDEAFVAVRYRKHRLNPRRPFLPLNGRQAFPHHAFANHPQPLALPLPL
jgi:hypothetical protein